MPRIFGPRGPWGWRPLVERVGDGYRVNLGRIEQRFVIESLDELRVMLANQDPHTRRLFPTAYPDDAQRDAEYHGMVGEDLLRGQLDALDTVERTIDGQVIDREELDAWMRAVNGVRLALGTRLDVSEEMGPVDLDDPNAHDWLVYEILTALLGSLIAVAGT
ncbi:MAG TPA: DUF2017 family protein [Acidimicrobiales bacterium]|nr:DUF2017 family protein [Acidimicrobiales bacterium]